MAGEQLHVVDQKESSRDGLKGVNSQWPDHLGPGLSQERFHVLTMLKHDECHTVQGQRHGRRDRAPIARDTIAFGSQK
jgi:hypothetical protein